MTIRKAVRHNSKLMQQRRARILEEARGIILREGIDALSVRALAEAAQVAVRTIYRLIGPKDEVLIALFAQSQQQWEERIDAVSSPDPLEMVEAAAVEAAALFAEDEEYHRSAYLAVEHLYEMRSRLPTVDRVFRHAQNLLIAGYQACIDRGLLEGNISAENLGHLALLARRNAVKEWAAGHIDIDRLRREVRLHAYIILMADGTPGFRDLVRSKLLDMDLPDADRGNRRDVNPTSPHDRR